MSNVLFDAPGPKAVRRHRLIGIATVIAMIAVVVVVVLKLSSAGQFSYEIWEPFVTPSIIEILLEGLRYVLQTAIIAIAGAVIFGMVFSIGKLSDHAWIRWPAWLVVEFFRAVPLLMLIIFLWSIEGFPLGSLRPLIIGLILYNGSVLAEVFRAGINALPAGQSEAAYAIGMRKNQVVRIIQLPQAIKIMLPSITSQCIVALKDTSLGFYILAPGLLFAGREIYRTFDNRFATAVVLAAVYIVLNLLLTRLFQLLQRRFGGESQAGADLGGAAPA
jgi:glutamate transport system permease protein